jgi:catechol 2,3-dioxygenase-like lactoylglutathione lyase family enzyme
MEMGSNIAGKVKLPPTLQIGIVVKDVNKVMDFYSSTFGIGPWEVREGESETKVGDQVYAFKTRVAFTQLGPVTLELFQVREGRSPVHALFLDRDREGVHHLGFYVSKEEKEKMITDLAEIGIGVVQQGEVPKRGSYAFLDTEKTGGVFFELVAKRME